MSLRLPPVLCMLLFLVGSPCLLQSSPATQPAADVARLEALAQTLAGDVIASKAAPAVSIAVARDGRVLLARGYGIANLEHNVPATQKTVYRIGSVTKQFTAAAVMQLVEQGRLNLDSPVADHLPDFPHAGRITIRQLLNHTSGLANYTALDPRHHQREFRLDLTYDEMRDLLADWPLAFEPGTRFSYTNTGYYLLGEIVARVTGEPFDLYMERNVLAPLGLDKTQFDHAHRVIPHRAAGYEVFFGTHLNAPYISMAVPAGAGAMASTVEDLARWTHLLHTGKVVSEETLATMTAPTSLPDGSTSHYGFGLVGVERNDQRFIAHGGQINGFASWAGHWPESGITVVVLANGSGAQVGQVALRLAEAAR